MAVHLLLISMLPVAVCLAMIELTMIYLGLN